MKYKTDQSGLTELFQDLKPVPYTAPPVYMLDEVLIGYDKLEQIRVIAAQNHPEETRKWLNKIFKFLFGVPYHTYSSS